MSSKKNWKLKKSTRAKHDRFCRVCNFDVQDVKPFSFENITFKSFYYLYVVYVILGICWKCLNLIWKNAFKTVLFQLGRWTQQWHFFSHSFWNNGFSAWFLLTISHIGTFQLIDQRHCNVSRFFVRISHLASNQNIHTFSV